MERHKTQELLRNALRSLIVNDLRLLNLHADGRAGSERAVASQFAQHIRPHFDMSWDVDVEYNRADAGDEARVKRTKDGPLLPDLIVHRRGLSGPDHNFVVLELKTSVADQGESGGSLQTVKDLQGTFSYQYAVFLDLRLQTDGMDPHWTWSEASDTEEESLVRVFPDGDCLDSLRSYGKRLEDWKYESLRHSGPCL